MKLSSSSLFLIKARRDSYHLQYTLHMTEELFLISKGLGFLEDLCPSFFSCWASITNVYKEEPSSEAQNSLKNTGCMC